MGGALEWSSNPKLDVLQFLVVLFASFSPWCLVYTVSLPLDSAARFPNTAVPSYLQGLLLNFIYLK